VFFSYDIRGKSGKLGKAGKWDKCHELWKVAKGQQIWQVIRLKDGQGLGLCFDRLGLGEDKGECHIVPMD
jgi:hypothetical protein